MTDLRNGQAQAPVYLNDVYLRPGDAIVVLGKQYVVRGKCSDPVGYIVGDPLAPDDAKPISSDQIKAWHRRNELRIVAREADDAGIPLGVRRNLRRDLATFPAPARREMIRRVRYCQALDELGTGFSRSERVLQPVCDDIATSRNDTGPHDWSSVYRWWKLWVRAGRDPRVLAPRDAEKGNRRSRLVDGVGKIIDDVVRRWYLRPGERMVSTCHAAFFAALVKKYGSAEKVWREDEAARERGLTLVISENGFAKKVTEVRRDIKIATRRGNKYARQELRPVGEGPVARFPFERVEADFKYMTLFVIDDRTGAPLGLPYLMAGIDCYSGCVAGWDIGFDPPSFVSASRCLRHVISFKDTSLYVDGEGQPVIRNVLPCNGVPHAFILDNDAVFHSEHFVETSRSLGCNVDYLRPGDPSSKGKIERLFRTVETYLDGLDGKQVKLARRLPSEFDPTKLPLVNLSELRTLIAKAFADVHHEGEEPDTFRRRLDLWSEGVDVRPPRPVPPHSDLIELVGGYVSRKADRRGIRLHGLRYQSSELAAYLCGLPKEERDISVRYDPEDVSKVWVVDRTRRISFSVPCMRRDYVLPEVEMKGGQKQVVPLTLHQHEVITRRAKELGGSGPVRYRRLLEARAELFALGREMTAKRRGRGFRQRVSRFFGPHIERAAEVERRRFDADESRASLKPPIARGFDDIEDHDDAVGDAVTSAAEFAASRVLPSGGAGADGSATGTGASIARTFQNRNASLARDREVTEAPPDAVGDPPAVDSSVREQRREASTPPAGNAERKRTRFIVFGEET